MSFKRLNPDITLRENLPADQAAHLKSYHIGVDGDGVPVGKYRYLEGHPRQYRFNGQVGRFFIGEDRDAGTKMTIQPLAFRIFEENLFNRGRRDEWAEIIFIDDSGNVAAIMFNNTSVSVLMKVIEDLFYDDKSLTDVRLEITPEKKTNDKGTYHTARFAVHDADPELTAEYAQFAADYRMYRANTLTPTAIYKLKSESFYAPEFPPVAAIE